MMGPLKKILFAALCILLLTGGSKMAQIWISGSSASLNGNASISATIDQLQQPDSAYTFFFRLDGAPWVDNGQNPTITFSGLSTDVQYTISGQVLHAGTFYQIGSVSYTVPTPLQPPPTPTNFMASAGINSVQLMWNPSPGMVNYYSVSLSNGASATVYTNAITFSGLSENTTYTATLYAVNDQGSSGTTSVTFTTDSTPGPVRPANWSWTTAEMNALNSGGNVSVITAARWNAFVSRMNEFRTYKGLSSYPGQVGSDKILYASLFRSVAVGIDYMRSLPTQSLKTVQTGQSLYGSYIIELTNTLNAIP